jgi:hypothetical protein
MDGGKAVVAALGAVAEKNKETLTKKVVGVNLELHNGSEKRILATEPNRARD